MPSSSDSSRSLTGRSSRSLTRFRTHRTWLQVLLVLGFLQVILGVLIVTFSLVAATVTASTRIRHSCPSWAGFSLALSGLVGIVSWKRPFSLVITFFTLLSVLGLMLSLAGSILSCQNAQLVHSLQLCERQRNSCICCRIRPEPPPPSCVAHGDALSVFPSPDCGSGRGALKDLLCAVCGLSVLSTIVCSVSAGICCVRLFSADITHVLVPQRSGSIPLGCSSPPLMPSVTDMDEFIPPVPPPPYYPPEYTCSSETDAQSITYNGSMDSPVPLYPTDCPPSYEAVMGLRGDSQATLFESQLIEGSYGCTCDQVPSIVLSGEASTGSGSALTDLPADGSSPSDDSCLLDPPGSARSVDYVLFRSIQRSRADYCLSVDCVRCSHHGRGPRGPFEDPPPQSRTRGERSFSCSTAEPGRTGPLPGGAVTHSCNRLEGLARGGGGPCLPEVRLRAGGGRGGGGGGSGRPFQPRRNSEASCPPSPAPATGPRAIMRSHSDPGTAASTENEFRDVLYTKAMEDAVSTSSADTGPYSELCPLHRPPLDPPPLFRAASVGKSKALPPPKKSPARSLGDLKVCRGLVARILHRPKHFVHGHKQVPGVSPDGLHLRSCGDLSSPSSLRRLLSNRRRPRSLSGGCKESAL